MIIIYHDVGGAHSTQAAAWAHLNRLPEGRIPTSEELLAIPLFDKAEKKDMGRIILAGIDEYGNSVYTLGRQYSDTVVIPALKDFHKVMGGNPDELMLVNMKPTINLLMKIGGFSSRRLHLVSFGRPIVTRGTQKAYPEIMNLVQAVKREAKVHSIKPQPARKLYDEPILTINKTPRL